MALKLPEMYLKRELNERYREAGLKPKQVRMLRDYFAIAANLYGVISINDAYQVLSPYLDNTITKPLFLSFAQINAHEESDYTIMGLRSLEGKKDTTAIGQKLLFNLLYLFHKSWDAFDDTLECGKLHPFYTPPIEVFLRYRDELYYERNLPTINLVQFLQKHFALSGEEIQRSIGLLSWCLRFRDMPLQEVFDNLKRDGIDICGMPQKEIEVFLECFMNFQNNVRKHALRGHTPQERMEATRRPGTFDIANLSFGPGIQKMLQTEGLSEEEFRANLKSDLMF